MDFKLSEDQKLIRDMVREFAQKELPDLAAQIDEKPGFPHQIISKMAQLGLFGLFIPEAFSGGGMDLLSLILTVEELSKHCSSIGIFTALQAGVIPYAITRYGTQKQKENYLPRIAAGKLLASISLNEPLFLNQDKTPVLTCRLEGENYILNGFNRLVLAAEEANLFLLIAQDEKQQWKLFLVENGIPGLKITGIENSMSLRDLKLGQMVLDNCIIPAGNLLGKGDIQLEIRADIFETGKLLIAAVSLGIAEMALLKARDYSLERKQFETVIADFEGMRWMMATMQSKVTQIRTLLAHAVNLKTAGEPAASEIAIAKMVAAESAIEITLDAIQVYGGYGYMKDFPLERYFREAKATEFILGTRSQQLNIIANKLIQK